MTTKSQFKTINQGLLVRAPAKINLSLLIAGKRDDGYHEIETVMAKINYFDEIQIYQSSHPGIHLTCSGPHWAPDGPENLVYHAAELICEYCSVTPCLNITLVKNIPAGTGLGSASSDAAATLIGINHFLQLSLSQQELTDLAAKIGSDVAFFLYGPLSLCTGRGEVVNEIRSSYNFTALLILPNISVSTSTVYKTYNHIPDIYSQLHQEIIVHIKENRIDFVAKMCANMLSKTCFSIEKDLAKAKEGIERRGIGKICLSGSGSALFCVVDPGTGSSQLHSMQKKIMRATGYKTVIVRNISW